MAEAKSPKSTKSEPDSPYDQKEADVKGKQLVMCEKAYKNESFLMSREARSIRILCEFEETVTRLRRNGVHGTFLFFGSARAMYRRDWEREMKLTRAKVDDMKLSDTQRREAGERVKRLEKTEWLCEYMEKCEELSRRLTEWAMTEEMRTISDEAMPAGGHSLRQTDPAYLCEGDQACMEGLHPQKYVVATGGGPGLMEAANKGASKVPGSRSSGFAISLPFEKGLNPYVTPELAFTFHYFFTRKYWMMYPAKVLIAMPGGFGTFDELFESVTLKQTGKKPPFPIVLMGKKYWTEVVNWEKLAELGTISQADCDQFKITDDVDDAFNYIKHSLISTGRSNPPTPNVQPAVASQMPLSPTQRPMD